MWFLVCYQISSLILNNAEAYAVQEVTLEYLRLLIEFS